VGNVTLPTPVFVAGTVACLLAGFLTGVVTAPGNVDNTTAKVVSYDQSKSQLCLTGDAVEDYPSRAEDGSLCGTWRRTPGSKVPSGGDDFRFVVVQTQGEVGGEQRMSTVLYGDVVE
jgi:hypothetical protein